MQEVQLDKHVKLLDSPGIVMDSGGSDASVILRNCVKVCGVWKCLLVFLKVFLCCLSLYRYIYKIILISMYLL